MSPPFEVLWGSSEADLSFVAIDSVCLSVASSVLSVILACDILKSLTILGSWLFSPQAEMSSVTAHKHSVLNELRYIE